LKVFRPFGAKGLFVQPLS